MRTLLTAVIAVLSMGLAVPAVADPYHDPYHPDYVRGWCPGGGTNQGVGVSYSNLTGWCNGVQYPDGTFWHQTAYTAFGRFRIDTACKTRNGILLSDAPSGGCGGEWG